jgi:hypothetical protein
MTVKKEKGGEETRIVRLFGLGFMDVRFGCERINGVFVIGWTVRKRTEKKL